MIGQFNKAITRIKRFCFLIFGIRYHGHGRDQPALGESLPESRHQQKFPDSLPLEVQVTSQASEQGCRKLLVVREVKALYDFIRHAAETDRVLR